MSTVEELLPEETVLSPTPAGAGPWTPFHPSPSPAVLNVSRPGPWIPFDLSQSPALVDLSNRSVGGGAVASEHAIAQEDVDRCLAACRSRRNLAARLANRIFSTEEKAKSNCRGLCGKKALNCLKVKAILSTCITHYPLDWLETGATAEKEMRNAIDKVCRKTKAAPGTENA